MKWKTVPSNPRYEVSNLGDVRLRGGAILSRYLDGFGYCRVNLRDDSGNAGVFFVHRLVCEAFHGPSPSPAHQVAHANGATADNRPENLRWATARENAADRKIHGKTAIGEKHGNSKLTEDQVSDMRKFALIGMSLNWIAAYYGVPYNTARNAVRGLRWGHVTG